MKRLAIIFALLAITTLYALPVWGEELTTPQPYKFVSEKPWGIVVDDDGSGFCRVYLTLSRVESSLIEILDEGDPDYGPGVFLQNPAQISSWLLYGIKRWRDDNPSKEIISIEFLNTSLFSAGKDGGTSPTTACIIYYKYK